MPTVSIIMPLYNAEETVSAAIDSIRRQSFTDWQLLIVDDCSSDGSATIVRRYVEQDGRIQLIALEHNSGAAVARNAAIERAQGRYIAFLDSDDQWLPEKLAVQLRFMRKHNHALTYSAYRMMSANGEPLETVVRPPTSLSYRELLKSNQIGCLTAIYDAEQLGKVTMPLIRARQDYALWLKILKRIDRAYGIDEVLALYRSGGGSLSSSKLKMVKFNWRLFREVEGFSPWRSLYYLGWNVYRKLVS